MCGPLALALPVHQRSTGGKLLGILLYNVGRSTMYALLGLLLGMVGSGFRWGGLQSGLSIITGIIMLAAVAYSSRWLDQLGTPAFLQKSVSFLQKKLGFLLHKRGFSALFTIGLLNGLLPCGLVYIALISAIAADTPIESAIYMAFFGMGTLPAMSAVAFVKNLFSLSLRNRVRRFLPAVVVVAGVLLIIRGFQAAPSFEASSPYAIPLCHGK